MTTQTLKPVTTRLHTLSIGTGWSNIQEDWRNSVREKFVRDFVVALDKDTVNTLYLLKWESFLAREDIYRQISRCYEDFPVVREYGWGLGITLVEPELVEISYVDKPSAERLLNHTGRKVLERIISIINELNRQNGWNLNKIEVCYVRDPDVRDWEYILIRLLFPSDFDTADAYLHGLYKELDKLSIELNTEERDRFQKLFYYDVVASTI